MLLIFFIFGICLGSFTTVLITRIPIGEDFVFSRSRCPSCAKKLSATELIPLLSWIMLKAKCKN
ncbi:MAG: prepilin peptidase, partial [Campylobacter sp.]